MTKKSTFSDPGLDNERLQSACEQLAQQLGLKDTEELAKFGRAIFPAQPTHVVIGENANGEMQALLVEGETEEWASQLLIVYLSLLNLGAEPVPDAPCDASFSPQHFWNCMSLKLLTRREVIEVAKRLEIAAQ